MQHLGKILWHAKGGFKLFLVDPKVGQERKTCLKEVVEENGVDGQGSRISPQI